MKCRTTKKITETIEKLKEKHLTFIFNSLVENNKLTRTTSICHDNSFKLWF
jgi:hypothetical protein